MWSQRLRLALDHRQEQHLMRHCTAYQSAQGIELIEAQGRRLINFSSNDYLGLAADGAGLATAAQRWGMGSGASHLVCGHSQAHADLEAALAALTGYPSARLFSTGYMANLGVISALLQRGDRLLQDKLNHASLLDAGLLSRATCQRYAHLDLVQLEQRLAQPLAAPHLQLVATDSVFSMDGDQADLAALSRLCQAHEAWLMVDDAHGLGVLGQGRGARAHWQLSPEHLPVYMGTLGKALGGFGAFVAGDAELIDYLTQFSRSLIYTTALPPALADAMLMQLPELINPQRQAALRANIQLWHALTPTLPVLPSATPIQPLLVGSSARALAISEHLRQQGFLVVAIRPPTVPAGQARLRITLTAAHQAEHITQLVEALHAALDHNPPSA